MGTKLPPRTNKNPTIVWAIDPTHDPAHSKNLVKELKVWARRLKCEIQPVYILSTAIFNFPYDVDLPREEEFEKFAYKLAVRYLDQVSFKDLRPPKILFTALSSNRAMTMALAKYAEKERAQLIFASAKAKKTWNPFNLGGFAETLMTVSRVPVLLLSPEAKPSSKIPSILFPTDFSLQSRKALLQLAPWARSFGAEILLYNQVELPNISAVETTGYWSTQYLNIESLAKDLEKSRNEKAIRWSQLLATQGVHCKHVVQRHQKSLTAQIVALARKKNITLIALSSESNLWSQTLLGSVARGLLLEVKCPVLIFHGTPPSTIQKSKALTDDRQEVPASAGR